MASRPSKAACFASTSASGFVKIWKPLGDQGRNKMFKTFERKWIMWTIHQFSGDVGGVQRGGGDKHFKSLFLMISSDVLYRFPVLMSNIIIIWNHFKKKTDMENMVSTFQFLSKKYGDHSSLRGKLEALAKKGSSWPSCIWKETVGATCQEAIALVMTRLIFALTVEDPVGGHQWNTNPWNRTCVVMKQLTVEDLQYLLEILRYCKHLKQHLLFDFKTQISAWRDTGAGLIYSPYTSLAAKTKTYQN